MTVLKYTTGQEIYVGDLVRMPPADEGEVTSIINDSNWIGVASLQPGIYVAFKNLGTLRFELGDPDLEFVRRQSGERLEII